MSPYYMQLKLLVCVFYVTGSIDDGDWSTEASYVCTWNVDRRGLNPKQPDLVIDVGTAVMAISFHPSRPSLIAGMLCLRSPLGGTQAVLLQCVASLNCL